LFIEPNEIELDAPFTDFGLDSIIAVQWMKAINSEFKLSLKATILYEYFSIRTLSDNILSEMARPIQQQSTEISTEGATDHAASSAALDSDGIEVARAATVDHVVEGASATAAAARAKEAIDQLLTDPIVVTQVDETGSDADTAATVSGETDVTPVATVAPDDTDDNMAMLTAPGVAVPGAMTKPLLPPPVDTIKKSLIDSLAKTLFMELHEIGEDASFVEFGMDSIIAVQWIKAINLEFSSSLKATILYEHSTISSLAGHLHEALSCGDKEPSISPEGQAEALMRDMRPINTQDDELIQSAACATSVTHPLVVELSTTASIDGDDAGSESVSINESLKRSLAKVLFVEAHTIGETAIFTELGLDLIVATHWIKVVNAEYGTALKATVLLEHSSIEMLAHHLSEQLVTMKQPNHLARSQTNAVRETTLQKDGAGQRRLGTVSAETLSTNTAFQDNFRYAVTGCNNVKVALAEVSPGLCLEVFSIGQGVPVLLMPPMGALATIWMYQIRELSKNYRVLVCHYPGHGRSGFVKEDVTFDRIAIDVLKIIDSFGIKEKLHLVGWSMGALISQKIALKEPENILSLTLISTPARVEQGGSLDSTITVLGNLVDDFVENVPSTATATPESNFEFIRAQFPMDVTMPYLNETLNFDYGSAARISQGTMIVFGAKDMVISPHHGAMLNDQIDNVRYFTHEEGGHYIPLQRHEWFNEKLLRFFAETEECMNLRSTEMVG
jgi:pimeloyl-ACP methyl ester carboxylesterase/acyl carrier protein